MSGVILVLLGSVHADAMAQKRSPAVTRDTDHDGVPDMRDRCPGTPAGLVVDAVGCPTGFTQSAPRADVLPAPVVPAVHAEPAALTARGPRVGIGVGVTPTGGDLLIPVLLRSGMSIEAEIEVGHGTFEISGTGQKANETDLRFGVGVGIPLMHMAGVRTYVAPRLVIVKQWTDDTATDPFTGQSTTTTATSTDWIGYLGLGAEVFVMPRASIGGEVQVRYTHMGGSGASVDTKGYDLRMAGMVAARWYFR